MTGNASLICKRSVVLFAGWLASTEGKLEAQDIKAATLNKQRREGEKGEIEGNGGGDVDADSGRAGIKDK